ncbi:6573_t:CDS:2, partial [Funneliformis mosseae]
EYGAKHTFRIHGGKKSTPKHLKLLSRIAIRQESDHLDTRNNYAIGDIESEKSSYKSKSLKFQIQASSYISSIKLIREELVLASEDKDSFAGQGRKKIKVTTHDQATSLIAYVKEISKLSDIIDDVENDNDRNNNHSSQI